MNTPHILTDEDINHIEDQEYTIMLTFGPAKTGYKRLYLVWRLAIEVLNSTTEDEAYQIAREQLKRLL